MSLAAALAATSHQHCMNPKSKCISSPHSPQFSCVTVKLTARTTPDAAVDIAAETPSTEKERELLLVQYAQMCTEIQVAV